MLFAETMLAASRIGDPSYPTGGQVSYLLVLIILGVAVTALITPGWRRRGVVLMLALPQTAAGYVLLNLAGFH